MRIKPWPEDLRQPRRRPSHAIDRVQRLTLRTLIYLALRPDRLCTVEEIAEAYDISANHLTKVVHQAALAGEIATVRGQHGGLKLGRRAETIRIGAVLRAPEPDLDVDPCFGPGAVCAIQPACVLQGVLSDALEAFLAVLDQDHARGPRASAAEAVLPAQSGARRMSDNFSN